jgi:hypothetical protein
MSEDTGPVARDKPRVLGARWVAEGKDQASWGMGLGGLRPSIPTATCKTMIYSDKTNHKTMRVGITKKIRMDQREADRLAKLARQLNLSETEVLREGLALIEKLQAGKVEPNDLRLGAGSDLKRMLQEFEHIFEQ